MNVSASGPFQFLFAEAPVEIFPWSTGLSGILGAASGTGFAIWVAWYLLSRVMPVREAAWMAQMEAAEKRCSDKFELMEKRHADHIQIVTTNSREDVRDAWKANKENSERMAIVLEKLAERIDACCKFEEGKGGCNAP